MNVDPTKFAAYMKFVKNNKLEEPTVRMIQQMVFDSKGQKALKSYAIHGR